MSRTQTFRSSLNRVSVAIGDMSLLEELRYLDKLCLLGSEHSDLEYAVNDAARRLEVAVSALPQRIAGGPTWPSFRKEIVAELESFLAAFDACDFAVACRRLCSMRDSVAVSRSYLAAHESMATPAADAHAAGWSLDELTADLRANGIRLE